MTRLVVLALALVGCAGQLTGATTFPASYYASGGAVPSPVPTCSGPITVSASDARPNPGVAGRRFEEDRPSVEYPINMTGDGAEYLSAAVAANLKRAGNPGAGSVASTVAVKLVKFELEEKTYHNAEFSGLLTLDVEVNAPGPCWKGQVTSAGADYGKAANPENYQETMNRAVEKAVADLLGQQPFKDALCGKCAAP